MNPDHDPVLLSRIEDAGLNASAPPQQRWLDGWLVRFSPGKAKRARCINAVAPGRLSIEEKLALCRPIYDTARLVLHVRVTPFSQPEGLDFRLDALGLERLDDTRVMGAARALDAVVIGIDVAEAEALVDPPRCEIVGLHLQVRRAGAQHLLAQRLRQATSAPGLRGEPIVEADKFGFAMAEAGAFQAGTGRAQPAAAAGRDS